VSIAVDPALRAGGAAERQGRIRFRVRIGVTGHRNIADPAVVRHAVRERLAEIRDAFPSTDVTDVRFAMLSSLAEGGDRLVATEAFTVLADAGVGLHAVLPMSAASYLEDFSTAGSREDFASLLEAASLTTELPPVDSREEAYERAGCYVVDNSDVLVAVWDGHAASGRGGTAAVVSYAQRRSVPVLVVTAERTASPTRSPDGAAIGAVAPWDPVRALTRGAAHVAYRRVDEFNRRSVHASDLTHAIEREHDRLMRAARGAAVRAHCELVAAWALPRLARADYLAMRYQRLYYRLGSLQYLLAALAVAIVAAQSAAGWSPKLSLLEVVFMLAVLMIYAVARRTGIRDRWLDCRSLAEAMRSALFIALTDMQIEHTRASLDGSVAVRGRWFQRVFSTVWEERPPSPSPMTAPDELSRFLIDGWLEHQISYHRKTIERLGASRARLTRTVIVLFAVTVLVGILHAFELLPSSGAKPTLVFLALALPSLGAALTGIRDLHQHRIHESRSERTAARLERLRNRVASGSDSASPQRLAAQIQGTIEAENADWFSVVEFQGLEVVV
jgi:hypothetical protein